MIKAGKWKKKAKFVRKNENYRVLKKIHAKIVLHRVCSGSWLTPEIAQVIKRARDYIGYSDKTAN
ncbi:MAG: hypothetical protein U9O94_01250, partial [Nanoarchaeota archaeon]|nr:hypothetical protein [Nanoarchaeota archaeon]